MSRIVDTSKIIFIGGAPRSGTTLVQRIVGSHSLVYGGPEFDLVPEIIKLRNGFHGSVESGRISKYLSHQEVDSLFGKFIALAFSYKLSKLEGKIYVSEKTPSNITVFPELAQMFPDSHLIFVMRDPRAVVASMLQVGARYKKESKKAPLFTKSLRGAVEYINLCWSAGSQVIGRQKNVHVVYYEDIIDQPELTIEHLASQLDLPFEPEMLQMKEYDMPESTIGAHYWYTNEQLCAPIMQDPINAWRKELTDYQQYVIRKRILRIQATERYELSGTDRWDYTILEIIANRWWELRGSVKRMMIRIGECAYRE